MTISETYVPFWDDYEDDVSDNVKYWVDIWRDLVDQISMNAHDISFFNPRLVLLDIVDEIDLNQLKNPQVKKLYKKKVEGYIRDESIKGSSLEIHFKAINQALNDKELDYIKALCLTTLQEFKNGCYFKNSLAELKKQLILDEHTESKKEIIKRISHHMIIEFILIGYSTKTIADMPSLIFQKYDRSNFEIRSPYEVDGMNCIDENGEYSQDMHYQRFLDGFTSIKWQDKIDKLLFFYFKSKETYICIFNIEGLVGSGEWFFNNVHFYSSEQHNYLKINVGHRKEFQTVEVFEDEYVEFLNAGVKVESIDYHAIIKEARSQLEYALDFLSGFNGTRSEFKINDANILISNDVGRLIGKSSKTDMDNPSGRALQAFDMNGVSSEFFPFLEKQNLAKKDELNFLQTKIAQSMRWFRKAKEAKTYEDEILNYWIIIENLVDIDDTKKKAFILPKESTTDINLARHILSSLAVVNETFYFELARVLQHSLRNDLFFNISTYLNIPTELLKEIGLFISSHHLDIQDVPIQNFIKALDKLEEHIKFSVLNEAIQKAIRFYRNEDNAQRNHFEARRSDIADEILLIYRLRNKIVHNAHYDSTILPFYSNKAKSLAYLLSTFVVNMYIEHPSMTLDEMLLRPLIHANLLEDRLKANETLTEDDFL